MQFLRRGTKIIYNRTKNVCTFGGILGKICNMKRRLFVSWFTIWQKWCILSNYDNHQKTKRRILNEEKNH